MNTLSRQRKKMKKSKDERERRKERKEKLEKVLCKFKDYMDGEVSKES
jgi:hypothetical protein